MKLTYSGKIKPYVRMTQRGKFVRKEAMDYLASQQEMKLRFVEQMNLEGLDPFGEDIPLTVHVDIYVTGSVHKCDVDNILKAVVDAAQGIAFPNDRFIDEMSIVRKPGDMNKMLLSIEEISNAGN